MTPTPNPTTPEAPDTSGASDFDEDDVTTAPKNPDPRRCVCRFDTDGTTLCGVHDHQVITYYDDRDDR